MSGKNSDNENRSTVELNFRIRLKTINEKYKNQSEFARAIGEKNQQKVNSWLLGRRTPNITNLCMIADALGCTTDYLLKRTDDPTPKTDIRAICDYTRLSAATIEKLHELDDRTGIARVIFEEMLISERGPSPIEKAIEDIIKSAEAANLWEAEADLVGIEDASKPFYSSKFGHWAMSSLRVSSMMIEEAVSEVTIRLTSRFEKVRDMIAMKMKESDGTGHFLPRSEDEAANYDN